MKNNLSIYDTGKVGTYSRRNEGWFISSCIGGGVFALVGFVMLFGGIYDPTFAAGIEYLGALIVAAMTAHGVGFATHRNVGLDDDGVEVMDAIYSLPKAERKRYKISAHDVSDLEYYEKQKVKDAIREYRRSRVSGAGVTRLLGDITEYNKTVKMIESGE